jgi:hypothetical protein
MRYWSRLPHRHWSTTASAPTLETYPRLGFKALLVPLIENQARLKPTSLVARHLTEFAFNDLVAAAPFAD